MEANVINQAKEIIENTQNLDEILAEMKKCRMKTLTLRRHRTNGKLIIFWSDRKRKVSGTYRCQVLFDTVVKDIVDDFLKDEYCLLNEEFQQYILCKVPSSDESEGRL